MEYLIERRRLRGKLHIFTVTDGIVLESGAGKNEKT